MGKVEASVQSLKVVFAKNFIIQVVNKNGEYNRL